MARVAATQRRTLDAALLPSCHITEKAMPDDATTRPGKNNARIRVGNNGPYWVSGGSNAYHADLDPQRRRRTHRLGQRRRPPHSRELRSVPLWPFRQQAVLRWHARQDWLRWPLHCGARAWRDAAQSL